MDLSIKLESRSFIIEIKSKLSSSNTNNKTNFDINKLQFLLLSLSEIRMSLSFFIAF